MLLRAGVEEEEVFGGAKSDSVLRDLALGSGGEVGGSGFVSISLRSSELLADAKYGGLGRGSGRGTGGGGGEASESESRVRSIHSDAPPEGRLDV